ncbi:MAG: sulfatase-like hydrolase/transferase [Armatimonadota bacterium]|nr:sulfatase-like hydrolase/transferase [Armatimonadota bacterium]
MNVLVVMFDSLRYDYLAFNGHPYIKTPNFDAFAAESVFFGNAIAEYPITIPSRTAMVTGNYTFPNRTWEPLRDTDVTFLPKLNEAGYHTCAFSDSPFKREAKMDRDFAEFHHYPTGKCHAPINPDRKVSLDNVYFTPDSCEVEVRCYTSSASNRMEMMEREGICSPDIITRDATKWLETHADNDNPFFLWLDYFDPHEPWDPPAPYCDMYDPGYTGKEIPMPALWADRLTPEELRHIRAQYAGCVTQVDNEFGKLRAAMERLGLWDDTIVLLISDHGEPFGEHGTVRKHFVPLYEELCHFVYMIRDPQGSLKGRRIDALVQNTDLAPTLMKRLGLEFSDCDGVDLNPLIRGEVAEVHEAAFLGALQYREAVRTLEWKFIDNRGERENELYNLLNDPEERNNLLSAEPAIAKKLHRMLWEFHIPWAGDWTWRSRPEKGFAG